MPLKKIINKITTTKIVVFPILSSFIGIDYHYQSVAVIYPIFESFGNMNYPFAKWN
jgi:hypothetical protein